MITLDTLRAEVARGMAPHDMNLLPGHETCAYCLENREHALKKADAAIALVLRAADEAIRAEANMPQHKDVPLFREGMKVAAFICRQAAAGGGR